MWYRYSRLLSLLLLPHLAFAVPAVTTGPRDPCTVAAALLVLIPGAQWTLGGNDYSTFAFVGVSTFTAPSQAQVDGQIATCHSQQTVLAAEVVELSTTTQALQTLYPNLLTSPTTDQINQAVIFNSRLGIIRNDLGR